MKPLNDALEIDSEDPLDVGVEGQASDWLDGRDACSLFSELRGTGVAPIIVTAGGFEYLWPMGHPDAKRRAADLAAYEAASAREALGEDTANARDHTERFEAALDRLGKACACDPMTVLHRLDLDTLGAIDSGDDEVDLDPECFEPDDVAEAYRVAVARRKELLATARKESPFGMVITSSFERPYDVETAIAELPCGPESRVLALATTPARVLLHLDFGGFNNCPPSSVHARVWEYWNEAIGLEPALIGEASITGIITRPITTRAALVKFAVEVASYDHDIIDGDLAFLGAVVRSSLVRFWWD